MAINELLDPISRVVSTEIYINDKQIDKNAVADYIENIEIEVNYFRHSIIGVFTCFEDLFTMSIGKTPNALTEKDTIRIIFEDKSGSVFDRRFNILKTQKNTNQTTNRSEQWNVIIEDIFGHTLNSSNFTRFITEYGFSGTPFEICQKAIITLFEYPYKLTNLYKDPKITLNAKRNILDFVTDDNPTINYRFSKDLTPIENIMVLANKYNIHIYQNFDTFNIIQNPTFENSEHSEDVTETSLYKELCDGKKYPYKICDKIKQDSSLSLNDRANYRISLNLGGKEQVIRELNFEDVIKIIDINNNSDEFKNLRCENTLEVSSSYSLLSTLLNESYKKYLKSSNIIIYTRPTLPYCIPGTLTTIDLATKSEFLNTRKQGDYRFSGIWLIRSTTLKILNNQFLIGRMVLCRFDNQPDSTNEEVANIITSDENEYILTNKPEKPKNLENEIKTKTSIEFNNIEDSSGTISQFNSILNQTSTISNTIKNGANGVEAVSSTFETLKSLQPSIEKVINIIAPPEALENVTTAISSSINVAYKEIKPIIDMIRNTVNAISEFFNSILSKFDIISDSAKPYKNNIPELISRITNSLRKFRSEIKSCLRNIENLIISEIKKYADDISMCLNKMVKAFALNIYCAIMNTVVDSDKKLSINALIIHSLLVTVLKVLFVDPLTSMIKDKIYGVFKNIVNNIRVISNKIDIIINSVTKPFESVEKTIDESIKLSQNIKSVPKRIMNRVQQQGPDIFRKSPKKIINTTENDIKQDLQSLKNKREKILKGLR